MRELATMVSVSMAIVLLICVLVQPDAFPAPKGILQVCCVAVIGVIAALLAIAWRKP